MRIKEVDKNIEEWYNSITETVAGAIGGVAMPLFKEPIKRTVKKKKKKKKNA